MAQDVNAEARNFAPLTVVILDHGEKVRTVEIEDPRDEFIKAFNEQGERYGLQAVA